jgi:hypothetical protein
MSKRKINRVKVIVDVEAGNRVALPTRADIAAGVAAHLKGATVTVRSVSADQTLTDRDLTVVGAYSMYGEDTIPDLEALRMTPVQD